MSLELKVFSGNANPVLAQEIAEHLGVKLVVANVKRFGDGETSVEVKESVRGSDVFLIQPTCFPTNDNVMELLIMIDALNRASASRITAVVPYYGYARQERKVRAREPITAKLIANLITTAGADRVVTMDLHAPAIQGFFDIPVDHLPAAPILADYFLKKGLDNLCVVSPDVGGVGRARNFSELINARLAIVDKRRPEPGVSEVMFVIGELEGKNVIMIDDIIDTGGTIVQAAEKLMEKGAARVFACCTHAVFTENAVNRLHSSVIEEVVVTNTIPVSPKALGSKIHMLSVASLLGDAILHIHENRSISKLLARPIQ